MALVTDAGREYAAKNADMFVFVENFTRRLTVSARRHGVRQIGGTRGR